MRFLKWTVYVVAALCVGVVILTYGPRLEARAFPVLDRSVVDYSRHGDVLTLFLKGEKLRECEIVSSKTTWVLSTGTVLPAPLERPDGTIFGDPLRGGLLAGDAFYVGPMTTRILQVAQDDQDAYLRVVSRHKCWTPWLVVTVTLLRLSDVPAATVIPSGSPTALEPY